MNPPDSTPDTLLVTLITLAITMLPVWLLLISWLIGRILAQRHLKDIAVREACWSQIPTLTGKRIPLSRDVASAELVVGTVVVSVDYFKRWLAAFRKFFGGELKSYSSMIERGRREAILRMKEASPDADMFINCRLETSTISNGQGKSVGCSEVIAYATAVKFR